MKGLQYLVSGKGKKRLNRKIIRWFQADMHVSIWLAITAQLLSKLIVTNFSVAA